MENNLLNSIIKINHARPGQWCVCVFVFYIPSPLVPMSICLESLAALLWLENLFLFVLSYAHSAHNTIIYIMSGFVLKNARTGRTANYTHTHTGHQTSRKKTRHTNESSSFCRCAVHVLWQVWFGYLRYGSLRLLCRRLSSVFSLSFRFSYDAHERQQPTKTRTSQMSQKKIGFLSSMVSRATNNEWARKTERRVECVCSTQKCGLK